MVETNTAIKSVLVGGSEEFPLAFTDTARWKSIPGVRPFTVDFETPPAFRSKLRTISKALTPVTLVHDTGDGEPKRWEKLFIMRVGPAPNSFTDTLTLADRRWLWSYPHIIRRYNIRRRVGVVRRPSGMEPAVQPITEDIQFAAWSLNNGKLYSPLDILTDVLGALKDGESRVVTGLGFTTVIEGEIGLLPAGTSEGTIIDDAGDMALARALRMLPGADVTIDPDGTIRVYSTASGLEETEQAKGGSRIFATGKILQTPNDATRPREVHVLFSREVELRFDFNETEGSSGPPTARTSEPKGRVKGKDERFVENVLPVPDFSLKLANGKTVTQGTWITIRDALAAWTTPAADTPLGKLDFDVVRRAFIPGMDLWSALTLTGQLDLDNDSRAWATRIAALKRHYRQTYRINSRWMDRILSVKAYLVGTIDPTSGQRAPAVAYSDHAVKTSQKAFIRDARKQKGVLKDIPYAYNVDGAPSGLPALKSGVFAIQPDKARPAPARVSIIDEDQGIIRVDYVIDPWFNAEMIFPSKIEGAPTMDVTHRTRAITFDSLSRNVDTVKLAAKHSIAIIVTAVPASPNSTNQLHRVIVKPNDVRSLLPVRALAGLSNANGPIREVRVVPSIETARVPWVDAEEATIDSIFGVGPSVVAGVNQPPEEPPSVQKMKSLTINDQGQAGIPGLSSASLPAIARAVAARVYAQEVDRQRGQEAYALNSDLVVAGSIEEIEHDVTAEGAATSRITMQGEPTDIDMFALLDEGTRRIVLKEVQPTK